MFFFISCIFFLLSTELVKTLQCPFSLLMLQVLLQYGWKVIFCSLFLSMGFSLLCTIYTSNLSLEENIFWSYSACIIPTKLILMYAIELQILLIIWKLQAWLLWNRHVYYLSIMKHGQSNKNVTAQNIRMQYVHLNWYEVIPMEIFKCWIHFIFHFLCFLKLLGCCNL